MAKTKVSLLKIEIKCKKVKIVNFDPMDIVMLASLFVEAGDTLNKNLQIRKDSYEKAKDYRKWVRPLLTSEKSWRDKRLVDDRHLVGLEIKDAQKLYDFILNVVFELKLIKTANAYNVRMKLIEYNKLINETIKNLQGI